MTNGDRGLAGFSDAEQPHFDPPNLEQPNSEAGNSTPKRTGDDLTELVEMQRAEIAHDIHDELLPLIFAASAGLHRIVDQADASSLSPSDLDRLLQITSWVDRAMQTGRQILNAAYPPELNSISWSDLAVATLDRILDEQTLKSTQIRWQISDSAKRISKPLACAAYRISVEAIRNACRHADASEIHVVSSLAENRFQLSIEDNGNGFDASDIGADRYGIRSMKGRASLVGGEVRIHSNQGGPTTVQFIADC